MNGLVATLALPLPRRLLRGVIFLLCCVLSVSLIGAVHTRTREADRATDDAVTAPEGSVRPLHLTLAPIRNPSRLPISIKTAAWI